MYTVKGHTAPMTGAFWYVIVDERGSRATFETIEFWDDFDDAQHAADQLNEEAECEGHPAGPYDPMGETVYCDGTCR